MPARSVTFIHAADLHMGAPFKGLRNSSPEWAEKMTKAVPAAFRRMIDTALEDAVDFVVLPGDLFDNSHPSFRDFRIFLRGMEELQSAGIPVYYCTGNHDPLISWQGDYAKLPENMHRFGVEDPSFFVYERDGEALALIGGRGYLNASFPPDDDVSRGIDRANAQRACGRTAPFVVGVMHSGLDVDPTRAPVDPKRLEGRGVDYWALGHVHHLQAIPDASHPFIAYSGTPQGRAIHEVGAHGILEVTLTEGAPNKARFIETASIEWQRVSVDVSEVSTIAELRELIISKQFALNASSYAKEMIFRIYLTGRTSLHKTLTPEVLEDLRVSLNEGFPFFYLDSLSNETQAPLDEENLRGEGLFSAVFLDSFDVMTADSSKLLSELEEEYRELGYGVPSISKRSLGKVSQHAKNIVLDLLA